MTFPLPAGCRKVCRPSRTRVRHFKIPALVRVVDSILTSGSATAEEVCEALQLFEELQKHCRPDCTKLKQLVDEWLREMEFVNQQVGIVDEFISDLLPGGE